MATPRALQLSLVGLVAFTLFSLSVMSGGNTECHSSESLIKQNAVRNEQDEILWAERIFALFSGWITPNRPNPREDIKEGVGIKGGDVTRHHTPPHANSLAAGQNDSTPGSVANNRSEAVAMDDTLPSVQFPSLDALLVRGGGGGVRNDAERHDASRATQITMQQEAARHVMGDRNQSRDASGTEAGNNGHMIPGSPSPPSDGASHSDPKSVIRLPDELPTHDREDKPPLASAGAKDGTMRIPKGNDIKVSGNVNTNDTLTWQETNPMTNFTVHDNGSDMISWNVNSRRLTSLDFKKNPAADGYVSINGASQGHVNIKDDGSHVNTTCELHPSTLVGLLRVSIPQKHTSLREVTSRHPEVTSGGRWQPRDCQPRQRLVVIIPFMDRWQNLSLFLDHIHSFLQRQKLQYRIIVVEQKHPAIFNRGAVLNAGFLEFGNGSDVDCVVLHDVDLLPEHDHNLYSCSSTPLHLSPSVNTLGYGDPGRRIGGVSAFTSRDFWSVNGFSNSFSGWGGEDDDLYMRLTKWRHIPVERAQRSVGRFTMIPHQRDLANPPGAKRLRGATFRGTNYSKDGLNSIHYRTEQIQNLPLFTLMSVSIMNSSDASQGVL